MCVCFIATLESLQHVSAYMGHLQVIFYKYRNTKFCLKTSPCNGSVDKAHSHTVAIYGFTSLPIIITQQDASHPPKVIIVLTFFYHSVFDLAKAHEGEDLVSAAPSHGVGTKVPNSMDFTF
jgi:hypothetical protein